jgi:hypothetical protein
MQTIGWMADSDSVHFSNKLSYKKHFISIYSSKDINFASLTHLHEFSENKTETGPDLSPRGEG